MRNGIQWLVIGALFAAVGYVAYYSSGAATPAPGAPASASSSSATPPPTRPHYASVWNTDFPAATRLAAADKKLILARFTGSDWCIYCMKFHDEIEDTLEFQTWAANRVVLFDADFPRKKELPQSLNEQNQALSEKYNIDGLPTLLLLKPDGTEVARFSYREGGANAWLPEAQAAVDAQDPAPKPPESRLP